MYIIPGLSNNLANDYNVIIVQRVVSIPFTFDISMGPYSYNLLEDDELEFSTSRSVRWVMCNFVV